MDEAIVGYKYGVVLDDETIPLVWEQIRLARELYNDLVAAMRITHADMQQFVLDHAGEDAKVIAGNIELLNDAFKVAKAAQDDAGIKRIAQERKALRTELYSVLKVVRTQYKDEIKSRFLSKIGKNAGMMTYQLRCAAVDKGLGWATASDVLDRALKAWSKRFSMGKPPEFAKGRDKTQDSLTLQFTASGGLPVSALFGKSKELSLAGGELLFRLGAANANHYATGKINLHRPLPPESHVVKAALIIKRVANRYYAEIQLTVKQAVDMAVIPKRQSLLAVHLGWSKGEAGRRIAGINDTNDPSTAQVVLLPDCVEQNLAAAADWQSRRDQARDALHPRLKEWIIEDETLYAELKAIQRLPAQYVNPERIQRLLTQCWIRGIEQPDWLAAWRKWDKKAWQQAGFLAEKAKNQRKEFYQQLAQQWAKNYAAIVVTKLDLKASAVKLDEETGERGEFVKKARVGQRAAALSQLMLILKWQAKKHGTALFEDTGEVNTLCASCGNPAMQESQEDWHTLRCTACGASHDRKENGASIAYQLNEGDIAQRVNLYHAEQRHAANESAIKKLARLKKMQDARRARKASDGENVGSSHYEKTST